MHTFKLVYFFGKLFNQFIIIRGKKVNGKNSTLLYYAWFNEKKDNIDKFTNYVGQPKFSQLFSLIDNSSVDLACKEHQANRISTKWLLKIIFLLCFILFFRKFLMRKLQSGFKLFEGKLNHFNLKQVPAGSTLSGVNKKDK